MPVDRFARIAASLAIAGSMVAQETGAAAKARAIHAQIREARAQWTAGRHAAARQALQEIWARQGTDLDLTTADGLAIARALGSAAARFEDVALADRVWRSVHDYLARVRGDDDPDLAVARMDLARTRVMLGDLRSALELQEAAHATLARTLPDDDSALQRARYNLAGMRGESGDLHGALALKEQVVAVRERTLPADHPHLALSLHGLAGSCVEVGDLDRARALAQRALAIRSRILTENDVDLHLARHLLGSILYQCGDLRGALALQEKVVPALARILPAGHHHLWGARLNLAATRKEFGDLIGARVLEEELAAATESLPYDHRDRVGIRENLAGTLFKLHDPRALELQQEMLAVRVRIEPSDSYTLANSRLNVAEMLLGQGDADGAAALLEKLVVQARAMPAHSTQRLSALLALATAREAQDRGEEARALREEVLASAGAGVAQADPRLQAARASLAWQIARSGDRQRATALALERAAAACAELSSWARSPRECGERARREQDALDQLLSFAAIDDDLQAELLRSALVVSQTLRGIEMRTARATRRARALDPPRVAALEATLREAAAEIARAVGDAGATDPAARDRRLAAAVQRREEAQRALVAIAAQAERRTGSAIAVADLVARLPQGAAACAIVGYRHLAPPDFGPSGEERLVALVVRADRDVQLVPLGARQVVEERVAALRAVAAGAQRGQRPPTVTDALALQADLRKVALDPVLAAIGDATTLFLSLDEALQLVPLDALPDALPDAQRGPLGARIALRPLVSLLDLLEQPAAAGDAGAVLLVCGGLDYDLRAKTAPSADPAPQERGGRPDSFRALLDSEQEAKLIARYFEKAFPDAEALLLTGANADKSTVLAAAARATFVHLATHGYFAPQTVASTADESASPILASDPIIGLSPLALAGLALSGANAPPDQLGDHAGILTAEEILAVDLSRCELVTLSACDTALGVRRAGQDYASLRAALQGAGARFVLASLWKVGDSATMELMADFYRRLWVDKKPPHVALWEARLEARRRGADFRDWAGWVLSGL